MKTSPDGSGFLEAATEGEVEVDALGEARVLDVEQADAGAEPAGLDLEHVEQGGLADLVAHLASSYAWAFSSTAVFR